MKGDSTHAQVESIRKLLLRFKMDKALDALLKLSKSLYGGQFKVEAELLKARLSKLNFKKRSAIVKLEDLNPQENRLIYDTLSLLQILQDEEKANNQLALLKQNQKEIANLKAVFEKLSFELSMETINRLGECWSEIYQFEREFKKINNEFVWHYLVQKNQDKRLNSISHLELEINSLFPIPPKPIKTSKQIKERVEAQQEIKEITTKAYSSKHKVSAKEHQYFNLKFQRLFERFEVPDNTLEKNKYWLPNNLYFYAREYHNCYLRFMFFFNLKNYKESLICLNNMEKEKGQVEKIVLNLELPEKILMQKGNELPYP